MKFYAGIGSRETPPEILTTMTNMAVFMANHGYKLRSGHAPGADQAFEKGCDLSQAPKEIFLPWRGFNGTTERLAKDHIVPFFSVELVDIAGKFHPNWPACSMSVRKLMARNVCQVLGEDMKTPSDFVACWTPQGSGSGGTGQAIRIAQAHDIPVFDLGRSNGEQDLVDYLNDRISQHEPAISQGPT